MARLSVVIPAYNRSGLIGESLRSLLVQTLPADEIIVVDDGSTDDTAAVAAAFGPPVKVIRRTNGGPAAARNTGFEASSGEFIHFFDSDDLAGANKHQIQVAALQNSGADIAYGPWIQGRFDGDVFAVSNKVLQQHGLPRQASMVKALLTYWSVVPHAALFRRKIVDKVRGFQEDLFGVEDQYMFLRCLLAGARVIHSPGTIEFYRLGDEGKITESRDGAVRRSREWARFLIKARESCTEKGIEPLRWFGYRRRLWEVDQDLRQLGFDDQALLGALGSLLQHRTPASCYRLHRQFGRWGGGLQSRLSGGRGHRSFRMGGMQPVQVEMLAKLGYRLAISQRARWWHRTPEDFSCVG